MWDIVSILWLYPDFHWLHSNCADKVVKAAFLLSYILACDILSLRIHRVLPGWSEGDTQQHWASPSSHLSWSFKEDSTVISSRQLALWVCDSFCLDCFAVGEEVTSWRDGRQSAGSLVQGPHRFLGSVRIYRCGVGRHLAYSVYNWLNLKFKHLSWWPDLRSDSRAIFFSCFVKLFLHLFVQKWSWSWFSDRESCNLLVDLWAPYWH